MTCTTKRRAYDTCSQSTTVENPVHLWLVPTPLSGDPEGAMATDFPGVHALYNNSDPNAAVFFATDATHSLYQGAGADFGTAHRSGNAVSFTLNAARGGTPPPGCQTVPLIEVSCSGTTELGRPEIVVDAGVGVGTDGAVLSEAVAGDAAFDADASQGVSCVSKRRVYDGVTCSQSTTVESPVHLWLVPTPLSGDPEGAMATDSPGVHALYNNSDPNAPVFLAADARHSLYQGAGADFGTARRSGNAVSFTLNAARGGTPPPGCQTVPLIDVT